MVSSLVEWTIPALARRIRYGGAQGWGTGLCRGWGTKHLRPELHCCGAPWRVRRARDCQAPEGWRRPSLPGTRDRRAFAMARLLRAGNLVRIWGRAAWPAFL